MKKLKSRALLFAMIMCSLLFLATGRITTKAAAGTLYDGKRFNAALKQFATSDANWTTVNKSVKKIVFRNKAISNASAYKKVAVGDKVNAYYEKRSGIVYIYYPGKITFSSNCDMMFRDFRALSAIDFGTDIVNTSPMTTADSMFRNCESIKSLNLSQFKTSNLTRTSSMFQCCYYLESLNIKSFDTAKVTDMHCMFMTCPSLTALNLSSFNTSKVTQMYEMFENCAALKSLDLRSFDTSGVVSMYRMFGYCSEMTSLNLSSFKTPALANVKEMFVGCGNIGYLNLSGFNMTKVKKEDAQAFLGDCSLLQTVDAPRVLNRDFRYDENSKYINNCQIGRVALDDNRDGKADSQTTYNYFIKSNKTHRYLFIDGIKRAKEKSNAAKAGGNGAGKSGSGSNGQNAAGNAQNNQNPVATPAQSRKVKVNGITYTISPQGSATVTKISSMKKADIDTVTVDGITYPVTRIGSACCQWNRKLSAISIGSNVEVIGNNAFYGSSKLKKIKITTTRSIKIGHGAFAKINRRASFKIKGLKGKEKKKLLRKLRKR